MAYIEVMNVKILLSSKKNTILNLHEQSTLLSTFCLKFTLILGSQ